MRVLVDKTTNNTIISITEPTRLWGGNVGPPGPQGPTGDSEEVAQAKRVDFITDTLLYRGEAAPGTSESEPYWRLRRIIIGSDNDVTEEWAQGNAEYNKIWNNRLVYSYS